MSQRERLLGRRLPPTVVRLRVDFTPEADRSYELLETEQRAVQTAEARGSDLETVYLRLAAARSVVEQYTEELSVSPLSADQYEQLVCEHPPSDELRKTGAQWAPTFVPALLAACIGQGDPDAMTVEDWAYFASTPSAVVAGEMNELFNACVAANFRTLDAYVGKGFGVGTRS